MTLDDLEKYVIKAKIENNSELLHYWLVDQRFLMKKDPDRFRGYYTSKAELAYDFGRDVDNCPHDKTREAACSDPEWAYFYARDVDKYPRDDTRKAACKDPFQALDYAKHVDACFHKETLAAVIDNKTCFKHYVDEVIPDELDYEAIRDRLRKKYL